MFSGTFSGLFTGAVSRNLTIVFVSIEIHCTCMHMSQRYCIIVTCATFFVVRGVPVEMYGKAGSPVCRYCKCYKRFNAEQREESNDTYS